jgi:hypothetical protein
MNLRASLVLGAIALFGVVACDLPAGGNVPLECTDGGTPTDPNTACNALVFGASPTVTTQQEAAAQPPAAGGSIANGTYWLTSRTEYTGPGGAAGPLMEVMRAVYSFNNGVLQMATFNPGACSINRQEGTIAVSGVGITYTNTCGCSGGGCGGSTSYTATATTFSLVDASGTTTVTTKQ